MKRLHRFANRAEAGRELAAAVATRVDRTPYPGRPLVLALPRGGVPVGIEVARAVDADLDIVVARKIGLPWQPELGIGAVTENGPPVFNDGLLRQLDLDVRQLKPLVQRERAEVRRRLHRYRKDRPPPRLAGRLVLVVDDGLATGITARAALDAARLQRPAHLVFAAPVCAVQSAQTLRPAAGQVVCACAPANLGAVGRWYDDFRQLSDDDVERLLHRADGAGVTREPGPRRPTG